MTTAAMPTLFGRGTAMLGERRNLPPVTAQLREQATNLALERCPLTKEFGALLDEFFDALLAHFAAEEDEGYFETLAKDCPELRGHLKRLFREHEDMVDAVEGMRYLTEHRASATELGQRLLDLLAAFELHERRESLVMQEFMDCRHSMPPRMPPQSSAMKRDVAGVGRRDALIEESRR